MPFRLLFIPVRFQCRSRKTAVIRGRCTHRIVMSDARPTNYFLTEIPYARANSYEYNYCGPAEYFTVLGPRGPGTRTTRDLATIDPPEPVKPFAR